MSEVLDAVPLRPSGVRPLADSATASRFSMPLFLYIYAHLQPYHTSNTQAWCSSTGKDVKSQGLARPQRPAIMYNHISARVYEDTLNTVGESAPSSTAPWSAAAARATP